MSILAVRPRRFLKTAPFFLALGLASPACALLAGLGDYHLRGAGGSAGGDAAVGACLSQVPEGGLGWGPALGPVTAVSAGDAHLCAVTPQNDLRCWGDNSDGQVDPTKTELPFTAVAVPVPSLGKVSRVAAGRTHTCAVTPSGEVTCWGDNLEGACGNDATELHHPPSTVDITSATEIFAGNGFTCALGHRSADSTQAVWCWGRNQQRSLGVTGDAFSTTPTAAPVAGATTLATCANCSTVCALSADKHVRCWGGAEFDSYATAAELTVGTNPAPIADAVGVAVGSSFDPAGAPLGDQVFVLREDGAVWTTTRDGGGVFGPVTSLVSGVSQMSASDHLAVLRGGKLQLSPPLGNSLVPVDVHPTPPSGILSITAGASVDCVRTDAGLSCTGDLRTGQVGNGLAEATTVPTRVATGVARMFKGPHCTTLVDHDGGASAFGNCQVYMAQSPWDPLLTPQAVTKIPASASLVRTGQLAQPTEDDSDQRAYALVPGEKYLYELTRGHSAKLGTLRADGVTDVVVGWWWTFLQRSDGTADLVAAAQMADPHGLFEGKDIAPGTTRTVKADGIAAAPWADHACAWKDGALSCWGKNDQGQAAPTAGNPDDVSDPVPIAIGTVKKAAVGISQTCALTTAGEVRCWGSNDHYELGGDHPEVDGTGTALLPLAGVTDLVGGPDYFCGYVDGEETLYCWGLDGYGAVGDGQLENPTSPKPILGPKGGVLELGSGRGSVCARMCDESVWCWGNSPYGEVGNGSAYVYGKWAEVLTAP